MEKARFWWSIGLVVGLGACETTAQSVPSTAGGDAGEPPTTGDAGQSTAPTSMPDAAPGAGDASAAKGDGAPSPDLSPPPDAPVAPVLPDAATLGPPTGACPSPVMCGAIAAEYEQALGAAASCMVGKDACGIKVATTLRCGSCEVWVSDDKALQAVRARFVAAGCEGCSFRLGPDGKCGPGACASLTSPMCLGNGGITPDPTKGTCGNAGGERPCPDGLRAGAPCTPLDYCIGNGHIVCSCGTAERTWTCI